ncbi:hypothetical protein SpCBS45565_g01856 [Spizellomyces sp. 'palustris']|nr:hypothetical protein SpCBS45565_g01856 [Spizellomyces sp. 'palustris']
MKLPTALISFLPLAAALPLSGKRDNGHSDSLKFTVIGDWGSGVPEQNVTGRAMQRVAEKNNAKFVIALGDNFYASNANSSKAAEYNYEGVKSATDGKWTDWWANVYQGRLAEIPWYGVAGNHDWAGLPKALVDRTQIKDQGKWRMDDFFWDMEIPYGQGKKAGFVFIDTDLLYYGYDGDNKYPAIAENFAAHNWTAQHHSIEAHLARIEKQLQKYDDKDYLLVSGHHPLGTCTAEKNMTSLLALLDKYAPTAYMYGHVHSLQYTVRQNKKGNTMYLQSGAGGRSEVVCPESKNLTTPSWGVGDTYGFVSAALDHKSLKVEYFDINGNSVYKAENGPRKGRKH